VIYSQDAIEGRVKPTDRYMSERLLNKAIDAPRRQVRVHITNIGGVHKVLDLERQLEEVRTKNVVVRKPCKGCKTEMMRNASKKELAIAQNNGKKMRKTTN
jgi:hypothetical protein